MNENQREIVRAYVELLKPRILVMNLVMTALGFYLASAAGVDAGRLVFALLGLALSVGGAAALNHYMEIDVDGRMERTRQRPLPSGRISPANCLGFGLVLVLLGVVTLNLKVNLLTAFITLLAVFLYVLVYTPMKRMSWLNTSIGAIPGALPPVAGWAAAAGTLDFGAWALFLILFIWQHPHFYAIAWIYRDDYRRGGFKMLPLAEPGGERAFRDAALYSALLIVASLLPTLIGMLDFVYFWGALLMGLWFFAASIAMLRTRTVAAASRLFRVSIIYLPLLFALIVVDYGLF